MDDQTLRNMELEMRRGVLTLSVLSQLKTPRYGYSLLQRLADQGMDIDQNTLYPLLRRLEKQGLLDSDWSVEGNRPRRYYVLNDQGREALQTMTEVWRDTTAVMQRLLDSSDFGEDVDQ